MEYPIVFEFGIVEQYSEIVKPIYEAVHKIITKTKNSPNFAIGYLPMLMKWTGEGGVVERGIN